MESSGGSVYGPSVRPRGWSPLLTSLGPYWAESSAAVARQARHLYVQCGVVSVQVAGASVVNMKAVQVHPIDARRIHRACVGRVADGAMLERVASPAAATVVFI